MGGNRGGKRAKKRSACEGWTLGGARANHTFLQTVDFVAMLALGYVGLAASLTVRNLPADAKEFHRALNAFLKELQRNHGLIAYHWVLEWQARGAPHLHLMLFFERLFQDQVVERPGGGQVTFPYADTLARIVVDVWLHHSQQWGTSGRGQHVVEMSDPDGWRDYLAKHASRGVHTAKDAQDPKKAVDPAKRTPTDQRNNDLMPETWKGRSGRVWGKSRTGWVLKEEERPDPPRPLKIATKRTMRRWEEARARKRLAQARVRVLRTKAYTPKGLDRVADREHGARKALAAKKHAGKTRSTHPMVVKELAKIEKAEDPLSPGRAMALAQAYASRTLGVTFDLPEEAMRRYLAWQEHRLLVDQIAMERRALAAERKRANRRAAPPEKTPSALHQMGWGKWASEHLPRPDQKEYA